MGTVHTARRTNANDGNVAIVQLSADLTRCPQTARSMRLCNQGVEAWLLYRRFSGIDRCDLGFAHVDPDHGMPLRCNAPGGGTANVTQTKDCNFHSNSLASKRFYLSWP